MFEGSAVALVTPFKDGQIDEKRLQESVEFQISNGTSVLVPCGTTGESATMSHQEHGRVIELVIKFARKRVPVMAGTGSNSTREAIEMTKHAKEAGADGALIVVPYYNKPTQRGLTEHFKAIAHAASFPLVVYNIPGRSGVNMLPSTIIELARAEKSIVGVKEASGNLDQATEIAAAMGPNFAVLSGDDSLTLPILSVGGKGVISVLANIAPKDVSDLCKAWKAGDAKKALELHQKMYPLVKSLFIETNPIPVKTAMAWMDLCGPEMRLPLVPMEKANEEKLEKALRAYGLLGPKRQHATC
jgi:4-hydroxy-tetrahydrodipicolinate synthase